MDKYKNYDRQSHSSHSWEKQWETDATTPPKRRSQAINWNRDFNGPDWESDSLNAPLRREGNGANPHDMPPTPKKIRWRRVICALLLFLSLLGFYGMGAYLQDLLSSAQKAVSQTYGKSNATQLRNVSDVIKKGKAFSVLILGTDTGSLGRHDTGRTDTMIVATVNPTTKRVTLTSIPRDLQVKVSGSANAYDKINSAYTYAGVTGAINTVQNTLHVPIDFYLLVNMGGLKKIVNALGGVTVKATLTFKYGNANVVKGQTYTLNGAQALDYSRMRDDDPLGDYGRQQRQKQIITAIIQKAVSVGSLSKFKSLLSAIESNMKTDMTYNDMITIETKYKAAGSTIKSYVLQGESQMIDGLSYQVASADTRKTVSDRIRKELGIAKYSGSFTTTLDATTTSSSTTDSSTTDTSSSYYSTTPTTGTGSGSGTDSSAGYQTSYGY